MASRSGMMAMSQARRLAWLAGAAGLAGLAGLVVAWLGSAESLRPLYLGACASLIVIAVITDRRFDELPPLMRPGVACVGAAVAASLNTDKLVGDDYAGYLIMWVTQAAGFVAAMLIPSAARPSAGVATRPNSELVRQLALVGWLAAVAAAAAFFAAYGVPALGGNVEQGREDAAASGTGLLRLMAYLSAPWAAVLVMQRARFQLIYPAGAGLILLGMGNRSPLLYLLIPVAVGIAMLSQQRDRANGRILAAACIGALLVVGLGTYRVFNAPEYAQYTEYRADIAERNILGVAETSLRNYAEVVPANASLARTLVDSGRIPWQYGATYLTLVTTALPGDAEPIDRTIKRLSGKTFLGGGIPPTLMGEGYINFGLFGTFFSAFVLLRTTRWLAYRLSSATARNATESVRLLVPLTHDLWRCP